jgi:hypothetical protein
VEFGHEDYRFYCDCGACPYNQWEFKCNDLRHGSVWSKYSNAALLKLLKALEAFEEMNILILGETGVGKSTWINAFINYPTFDSLDEAMQSEELRYAVPCSFTALIKDKSDRQGSHVQKKIMTGSTSSENDDPAGQSATRETSVYPLDIGSTRVRLVDTPDIGGTGGVEQDEKNMADILGVLRSYRKLHGILILLKPNVSRLTVMFRFCIGQLLTYLHRNAANNIVFGFTNTRGSNYAPGDTFKSLQFLLREYKEVEIGLYSRNVYCFDSESFRYLAAYKQGVDMGLLEDNARSWKHSVEECQRLVKYFQGLNPHEVQSTLSLNETRNNILQMMKPMVFIRHSIAAFIEVNDDQVKELQQQIFARKEMEQKLFVERKGMESFIADDSLTVSTHYISEDAPSDLEERHEASIISKTMCNEDLNAGLTKNAKDNELQEKAIRMKKAAIGKYEIERRILQEAEIQFGAFLKRHAIAPYNDATLEYLDQLINREKMNVQNEGRKERLNNLEKYKREYIQKVDTLQKTMEMETSGEVLDDE